MILAQHFRLLTQQTDRFHQQVAEVGRVQRLQAFLIGRVEFLPASARKARRLAGRDLRRRQPAILPAVDMMRQHARRPALLVDVLRREQLLEQADLVVGVEDGEARLEADHLGMPAQNLDADRVEGAEPGHALDRFADHRADAQLHLARRLVGEGDGENFRRARAAEAEDVRDAGRQHAGLAGAGAGQHQHGAIERLDRFALLRIEPVEVAGRRLRARARRDPARKRGGRAEQVRCLAGVGQERSRVDDSLRTKWHRAPPFARGLAAKT